MAALNGNNLAAIGVAAGVALAAFGVSMGEAGDIWKAAGIGSAALMLFATRVVPEFVVAFGIFLAALTLGVIPREEVFSGFMSGGFWLLVSGIILGAAITATGLAARISGRLIDFTGPSYPRAVFIIAGAGMALGILIPSTMPRIVVMIPIAAALAERLGLAPDGKGAIGLIATAATATLLPTYTFLTANLPTIVHVGAMDQLYGIHNTYSGYLFHQFPVNLLRFALLVLLMAGFCREPITNPSTNLVEATAGQPEQRGLHLVLGGGHRDVDDRFCPWHSPCMDCDDGCGDCDLASVRYAESNRNARTDRSDSSDLLCLHRDGRRRRPRGGA